MTSEYSGSRHSLFRGLGQGSRLAGYLIEEQIGTGGMAVVFRARDEVLGRLAAVKVIAPSLAGDEEFRTRFLRESRAAAAVDSLHIVPVYGAGEAGELLYIATRFVAGGDLAAMLRRSGGRLAPERAVSLVAQVASALDAAHAAGLVHRDVKPGNVLIDTMPERAEHAYLSDFGLSRTAASTGLTASGEFLGTPDYCAPEQIRSARVDGRADQYALGCVAFALLTGTTPFHREEAVGTLFAHVQDPVPPATGLRPELPPAVDEVFARALAKSPADRYGGCGEFATALRAALLSEDHPATLAGELARPAGDDVSALSGAPRAQAANGVTVLPAPATGSPAVTGEGNGYADTITSGNASADRSQGVPRQDHERGRGKALATWAAATVAIVLAAGTLAAVLLRHSPPASPKLASQGASHPAASHAAAHPAVSQTASRPAATVASPQPGKGEGITSRLLSAGSYGFNVPRSIASDGTHIWTANWSGNSVTELNASDGAWVRTLSGGDYGFDLPDGIASDGTHVWVANGGNSVTELNAADGSLVRVLSGGDYGFNYPVAITTDGSHVWVANGSGGTTRYFPSGDGSVTELNASDGSLVRTVQGASYGFNQPDAIASDGTHIWVANKYGDWGSPNLDEVVVTELSASDGSLVRALKGPARNAYQPDAIAADGVHVWVANEGSTGNDSSLTELNASDGTQVRTLAGNGYAFDTPDAIASDGTHIWVANYYGGPDKARGSVLELNGSDGSLIRALPGTSYGFSEPAAIVAAGGHIWVANAKGNSVTELTLG